MMQGHQPLLDIGAGAHFLRAAHENSDFSRTHFLEQNMFLHVAVIILHEGDLFGGNAASGKFGFQIIVSGKLAA